MLKSEPPGAEVYVNGSPMGRTPTNASLKTSETHNIEFRMEGFERNSFILNNHVGAGWIILDILCGLIPIIIDAAASSWYELDENEVSVVLRQGSSVAVAATETPRKDTSKDIRVAEHIKKHAKTYVVAVFDIQDKSNQFSNKVMEQLTDYLAVQLTEVAGYRVAPREQLRQKLAADKKESYEGRFDADYQVELGKALAAQKTLVTKIIQVGNKCNISATLFDLTTETTDQAASTDTLCSIDALMEGIKQITVKLSIEAR